MVNRRQILKTIFVSPLAAFLGTKIVGEPKSKTVSDSTRIGTGVYTEDGTELTYMKWRAAE